MPIIPTVQTSKKKVPDESCRISRPWARLCNSGVKTALRSHLPPSAGLFVVLTTDCPPFISPPPVVIVVVQNQIIKKP